MVGSSLAAMLVVMISLMAPQSVPRTQTTKPPVAPKTQTMAAEAERRIDLIVDVLTAPNKYWNLPVTFKAHVVGVKVDPPGTQRGSYMFRDASDRDIEVQTQDLPAVGTEFFVYGTVVQLTMTTKVPVLREDARAATPAELETRIKALMKK